jgi:hypothetical membrane protein
MHYQVWAVPPRNFYLSKKSLFLRLAACCGLVAPFVFWIGVFIVGRLQPDYDWLADTVSKMGRIGRPYAEAANGVLMATGLLLALFVQALPRQRRWRGLSGPTLLTFFSLFGLTGAGLFPCDEFCAGMSAENILHTLPVALGFASLQIALLQFAGESHATSLWQNVPEISQALFWAGSGALIAFTLGRWGVIPILESFAGFSEKIYLFMLFAFIFALARRVNQRPGWLHPEINKSI